MGTIVLKLLCFEKELKEMEMTGRLMHVGQVLVGDKGFLVVVEFISNSSL